MRLRITARCIIINDGKVLVQVSRRGNFYKLPGGKIKPSEPVLHTLERELYEELGLRFNEPPRLVGVVDSFYRDRLAIVHEIGFYFLCSVEGEPVPRENHIEVKWLEPGSEDFVKLKPDAVQEIVSKLASGDTPSQSYYISIDF